MSKTYEELFEEYAEKFGEIFPNRMAPSDEEEQMKLMKKAIETGEPYDPYDDPDFDPEADY